MWFDVIRVTIHEMHVKCWKIVCKSPDPLFLLCRVRIHQMDILNRQDCKSLKSEWFNLLADSIHVKNRINWIHNKTGSNEQSTRPKKLGHGHIKAHHITLARHFHFHAVLPGLVRFSFPNLGRCEATRKACSHVMSCECLRRVLFQIFWNLALWWIWALWEYSPIQPWSFTRLTLAKLRPGNERKCVWS